MTSNIGSEYLLKGNTEENRKAVREELNQHFKPEFLNRIDDIIFFNSLDNSVVNKISKKFIDELAERLQKKEIYLSISQKALEQISQEGFDATYGARPLKRYIQNNIENPLAMKIISNEIKEKDHVEIDYQNGFTFNVK